MLSKIKFISLLLTGLVLLSFLYEVKKKKKKKNITADELYKDQCYHGIFSDILLVINFNYPYYDNLALLKDIYEGAFLHIISCGPPSTLQPWLKPDIMVNETYGDFAYLCMAMAMERFPNHKGYMFGNDDMIINWWTMTKEDTNQIWHGTQVIDWRQKPNSPIVNTRWKWWATDNGLTACQSFLHDLKLLVQTPSNNNKTLTLFDMHLKNNENSPRCAKGWIDFYYIPGRYREQFMVLSYMAYKHRVYHEIIVHVILSCLDLFENFRVLNGVYLPDVAGRTEYSAHDFWRFYNHEVAFIHPFKFLGKGRYESMKKLKTQVITFKDKLTSC